jgi:hypothetical protein
MFENRAGSGRVSRDCYQRPLCVPDSHDLFVRTRMEIPVLPARSRGGATGCVGRPSGCGGVHEVPHHAVWPTQQVSDLIPNRQFRVHYTLQRPAETFLLYTRLILGPFHFSPRGSSRECSSSQRRVCTQGTPSGERGL